MISEDKIIDFINKNDNKTIESKLNQYKKLIIRLLNQDIKKNKIYDFIKSEDENIGNKISFYSYINKNIINKPNQEQVQEQELKQELKETPKLKQELKVKKSSGSRAVDILMQDFDFTDYDYSDDDN